MLSFATAIALLAFTPIAEASSDVRTKDVGFMRKRASPISPEVLGLRSDVEMGQTIWQNGSLVPPRRPGRPGEPDKCPPCFNCLLPAFQCGNAGECNPYDGQCRCPPGFGGQDCLNPVCGALTDGDERYPRPEGELCHCKEGWGGINCNVCKTDKACKPFKPRTPIDDGNGGQIPDDGDEDTNDMVCYKGGLAVEHNYQMCDVTNRKIIDTIPDNKPPQVTFDCTADGPSSNSTEWRDRLSTSQLTDYPAAGPDHTGKCTFQFWVDRIESFYCKLDECRWNFGDSPDSRGATYECKKLDCYCVPGQFLCGQDGSVNIDDFLTEEVKGPGTFACTQDKGCTFSEPAMNGLINDIFGDRAIFLDCAAGECLHYTQVPGFVRPTPPDNSALVAVSAAGAAAVFIAACILVWYYGRTRRESPGFGGVELPEDEASKLMTDHVPATLHFSNVSYSLPSGKPILSHVTGTVRPGELLAIMGASGAGKSTLLDILARKNKSGAVEGDFYVNGRAIPDESFRRVTGYVDQEDTLLSTLTVYEAVLYSALLRLPREMSHQAKVYRTLETMNELGILSIKDSRIGESGKRSISGGEKRRVSIACELVTGPSILFLDEPTSGLDSYNAYNVISSLSALAKQYNRTVIFTIHQPQSNIVKLFDRLVLLAKGQLVYAGDSSRAAQHFEKHGHKCPEGYNIADYLIDVTVEASGDSRVRSQGEVNGHLDAVAGRGSRRTDEEDVDDDDDDLPGKSKVTFGGMTNKAARLLGFGTANSSSSTRSGSSTPRDATHVPQKLANLVLANRASDDTKIVEAEIGRIQRGTTPDGIDRVNGVASSLVADDDGTGRDRRDVEELRGYRKASWGTQFTLLSGRAFKNLYRNPLLMGTHYAVAVGVAFICGFFFYKVTNDISGFQNRLGLFLFILSLFGFSCLSSLGIFSNERMLFMRERANGYYAPSAYFLSKVLFDVLPLRVIPPFVLGSIVYGLAGLNPEVSCFWKFIMTLVLFNLTASSVVLFLSVAVKDLGVANLLGSLVMLYNLLFAGLLMNYDHVPKGFKWMLTTSFFHAAYEALLVNELRYLQLIEHKFGLDIQVPSATILSSFGFHAQAFWWPDISLLAIVFGVFTLLSYLVLEIFVKEKR